MPSVGPSFLPSKDPSNAKPLVAAEHTERTVRDPLAVSLLLELEALDTHRHGA